MSLSTASNTPSTIASTVHGSVVPLQWLTGAPHHLTSMYLRLACSYVAGWSCQLLGAGGRAASAVSTCRVWLVPVDDCGLTFRSRCGSRAGRSLCVVGLRG